MRFDTPDGSTFDNLDAAIAHEMTPCSRCGALGWIDPCLSCRDIDDQRDRAVIARIGGNDIRKALYAEHGATPIADRRFTPRRVYLSDRELQARVDRWAWNAAEGVRLDAKMRAEYPGIERYR